MLLRRSPARRRGAPGIPSALAALVLAALAGPALAEARPSFSTRVEPRFGASPFYFSTGDWRAKRQSRWTNLRSGERRIAANFLVQDEDVPVAILFAAEAQVDTEGKRMFLRILVDGQPMAPGDVVLASGEAAPTKGTKAGRRAAQSFEFTALLDRGIHTAEAQWLVDDGATGYVRQAGLLIRQGDVALARGALLGVTPESGRSVETKTSGWQDVPGLGTAIDTRERDCLTATVSGEAFASSGKSGWLRVLVDGAAAEPGPVAFVHGGFEGTRSMVFGLCDLDPGEHDVRAQWHADPGGSAWFGDRTLVVSALPTGNFEPLRQFFVAAAGTTPAPGGYGVMPGMSRPVMVTPNSEIAVLLSVELPEPPPGDVYARLVVHGQPVPDSEVLLADEQTSAGVHAFVFNAKHVHAGAVTTFGSIEVEWMAGDGGGADVRARSMSIQVQPQPVPDLATPPPFGGVVAEARIEPMRGPHDVLLILWDPARPGHPAPSLADLEASFSGSSSSVADYYRTVSDQRFTLDVVDVLGPYSADFPWGHYWNGPGDHQDKWVEAIAAADDDFDFSKYDRDGDGYVHPWHELAIVIVVPQADSTGYVRHLWFDSGDTPQQFDGVDIELITEWYVSEPLDDYMVAAHELGHQILMLADLYGKNLSAPPNQQHGTRPGRLSLMDATPGGLTAHLDGASKLALGWVTPRFVTQSDTYTLEDVKSGREVLVLPRLPGASEAEYLVVENRQDAAANALYDMGLLDSGLAVWHLVEGTADNAPAPPCTPAGVWNAQTGADNHRRGIRLRRPAVAYSTASALWSSDDYDFDPWGLSCPGRAEAHNALLWADGSPSYGLLGFSPAGQTMTFDVLVP